MLKSEIDLVGGLESTPLLMCSSAALADCHFPRNWRGCVLSSARVLEQINIDYEKNFHKLPNVQELVFNKPIDIDCVNRAASHTVEVTMLSCGEYDADNVMFLIKDKYMTTLLTSGNGIRIDLLTRDQHIRQAIKDGIDRILFDETLFLTDCCSLTATGIARKLTCEQSLCEIVYLVRPQAVLSLANSTLPEHIDYFCRDVDYYTD